MSTTSGCKVCRQKKNRVCDKNSFPLEFFLTDKILNKITIYSKQERISLSHDKLDGNDENRLLSFPL